MLRMAFTFSFQGWSAAGAWGSWLGGEGVAGWASQGRGSKAQPLLRGLDQACGPREVLGGPSHAAMRAGAGAAGLRVCHPAGPPMPSLLRLFALCFIHAVDD